MGLRVGMGYDLHKIIDGRELFLGGIEIPFPKGPKSHSDGDILLHALCDSLFGALGLPDIGTHFPDTDAEFKDISGLELLKRTYDIISKGRSVKIVNIDSIIICDEPKLSSYIPEMKEGIAKILNVKTDDIGIKSKTTEGTSPDTISSYVVALVEVCD